MLRLILGEGVAGEIVGVADVVDARQQGGEGAAVGDHAADRGAAIYRELAWANWRAGRKQRALDAAALAGEHSGDSTAVVNRVCIELEKRGAIELAGAAAERGRAAGAGAALGRLWASAGMYREAADDMAGADEAFRAAVRLLPDDMEVSQNRARFLPARPQRGGHCPARALRRPSPPRGPRGRRPWLPRQYSASPISPPAAAPTPSASSPAPSPSPSPAPRSMPACAPAPPRKPGCTCSR